MDDWRDIAGYGGEYQVDVNGNVRRKTLNYRNRYNEKVAQKPLPSGYMQVWLGSREGKNHYVHRLVAFAFIGPQPDDCHQVAHWDGNKKNNHVSNLRWATRSENRLDMRRQNANPKLTWVEVNQIRARQSESNAVLAKEFGVVHSHIRRIIRREQWN